MEQFSASLQDQPRPVRLGDDYLLYSLKHIIIHILWTFIYILYCCFQCQLISSRKIIQIFNFEILWKQGHEWQHKILNLFVYIVVKILLMNVMEIMNTGRDEQTAYAYHIS